MKGQEKIIDVLNALLSDELTAINECIVHSKMCENWGYKKLHKSIMMQAMDEMHHAEWLIERIIFLEGIPAVKLNKVIIAPTILEMIENNYTDEFIGVRSYNDAIKSSRDLKDQGTVDLLTKILNMEEGHVDWAESQKSQIDQMGLKNYLVNQTTEI